MNLFRGNLEFYIDESFTSCIQVRKLNFACHFAYHRVCRTDVTAKYAVVRQSDRGFRINVCLINLSLTF
jgi:hypothetical protein